MSRSQMRRLNTGLEDWESDACDVMNRRTEQKCKIDRISVELGNRFNQLCLCPSTKKSQPSSRTLNSKCQRRKRAISSTRLFLSPLPTTLNLLNWSIQILGCSLWSIPQTHQITVPICVATDFIECHWHFDLFGSQWIGMFFFLFNLFGSSQIVGLAPVISRKPYLRTSQNHLHLTSGQTPANDARWWVCEYKECKDQNGLQGSREINHLSSL